MARIALRGVQRLGRDDPHVGVDPLPAVAAKPPAPPFQEPPPGTGPLPKPP